MKHVLSAQQFERAELTDMFARTDYMQEQYATMAGRRELFATHTGRKMAAVFYEASTRTRMSFVSAAQSLGMGIVETENAALFSSAAKGETIEDSARVIGHYADILVIRSTEIGAVEKAASVSPVPVINGGDGAGEHPTQSLLDAYTIQNEKGRLQDLNIVIGGDLLHGRTVRSLAQLLALYPNNSISFVSTPDLQIGADIRHYLDQHETTHIETDDLYGVLPNADVVYWTRLQKERLKDPALEAGFVIGQMALDVMREDAIIMHPLPRVGEIETLVDGDPRAAYFRQAENGLHLRTALLDQLVGEAA